MSTAANTMLVGVMGELFLAEPENIGIRLYNSGVNCPSPFLELECNHRVFTLYEEFAGTERPTTYTLYRQDLPTFCMESVAKITSDSSVVESTEGLASWLIGMLRLHTKTVN